MFYDDKKTRKKKIWFDKMAEEQRLIKKFEKLKIRSHNSHEEYHWPVKGVEEFIRKMKPIFKKCLVDKNTPFVFRMCEDLFEPFFGWDPMPFKEAKKMFLENVETHIEDYY